ncbi:bifunctional folylpolyglutamate synthase/dihydrofolate synthase [Capnocytophaga catalasegens]|uniref:Dihydrofolate synthase/folylpolyglutamate synthase n=1 Tax=Capnocytophaga catalasegens TaxID=1004260 RepID=A0AAV5AVF8_9FLAO|nr:folylpolyglutamate synthase/dihydrofolate synthase family protein [Capnocytophaga catalasegens]GIZ15140.1 tetrahydrofolate synthase [Capnocytophaga catalasegens]GJM49655.1 tetrahydrofolate synthase [Capnocytophaga catalasegens]GJM52720.1 tetrahydrofolate synthase [Capnocytophaga catalasegens]
MTTYQQTITWMFNQLPMFQSKGISALKHKLDNIQLFCQVLKNPQQNFPSIHIGGTNGKGSSSHAIASILQEAGYNVGLYTSPHLKDFRERIKINGKEVSQEFVVQFIEQNRSFLEDNQLSFFEMTVAMAFSYFSEQRVDIAVIEVGLGGRFDSTNIIKPEVSLITNIDKDHTDILGETLEKIAYEKAGIIKENTPIIISEYNPITAAVFQKEAMLKQANIQFVNDLSVSYSMDLKGKYQQKNIKGIVGVINVLQQKGWKITEETIEKGLANIVKNTGLKGRWQVLSQNPKIICDTGHNKHGLTLVLEQLLQEKYQHLHIVLGFVKEKNIDEILPMFPLHATYYFCRPNIPRGLDEFVLAQKANQIGLEGNFYSSVHNALEAAKRQSSSEDVIFVGGSTFVVAEIV